MCIIEQVEAACLSLVNPGSFRIRATALTLKPPTAAAGSDKGPQVAFPASGLALKMVHRPAVLLELGTSNIILH